jgi:hypothetical protein
LFSDTTRTRSPSCFIPFAKEKYASHEQKLLNHEMNQVTANRWAHILQPRNLIVLKNKISGFEVYNPNFLARQFGLIQAILVPPTFTVNSPWNQRKPFPNDEALLTLLEGLSTISIEKVSKLYLMQILFSKICGKLS